MALNRACTLGRTEPDYSIDIADLSELNMIEAEKEIMRRECSEGKLKSHPSILFSCEYMQGEQRKDTLYYLSQLESCEQRNESNRCYLRHLRILEDYRTLRKQYRTVHECKLHNPNTYDQYRISLVAVNRYRRLLKGEWTRPSLTGKLVNQYRCISCGVRMPKGRTDITCVKCERGESERFHDRGLWKMAILNEEIQRAINGNCMRSFGEFYAEVRTNFNRRVAPIRRQRKKARMGKWMRERWKNPEIRAMLNARHDKWAKSERGRKYRKEYMHKWNADNRDKILNYRRSHRLKMGDIHGPAS